VDTPAHLFWETPHVVSARIGRLTFPAIAALAATPAWSTAAAAPPPPPATPAAAAPAKLVRRPAQAAVAAGQPDAGDRLLDDYFRAHRRRRRRTLADVRSAPTGTPQGRVPPAARRDARPVAGAAADGPQAGRHRHGRPPEFTVDKVQFQSMPGLYVTGKRYVPKNARRAELPTILYVCGHGNT
jgi:hypothetical protein